METLGLGHGARVIRWSIGVSGVVAATALAGFAVAGAPVAGVLLAIGIGVGALNGVATGRLYATGLPFSATSMLRLVGISALILVSAVSLGVTHVWPFVLGLGLAQLALAGSAALVAIRS